MPWLLILFGAGMFVGNILGGKAADRALDASLIVILSLLTAVLVAFALLADSQIATIAILVLMGGFGFATVPGLQMRVMNYAGDASTLVSGANIGAFNIGNAVGAYIGGVTITAGFGYTSPIWAGAILTAVGVLVMSGAAMAARRPARRTAGRTAHSTPETAPESGLPPESGLLDVSKNDAHSSRR